MGQYFKVVNLDKKEVLHPHKLGDGLKLMEFGGGGGTMLALAVLLADNSDHRVEGPLVGSWSGDRIVIAGDYGPHFPGEGEDGDSLYDIASNTYDDISLEIRAVLENAGESLGARWDAV